MATLTQHKNIVEQANKITNRKTLYAAGAGLIPFPIVDAAALLGVQLTMIHSISKLYDIPFKKHRVKSLIASLIGSGGTVGLIKLIPGLGTIIGGATSAVAGAAATYALGRVFTQHFDQGGTLLNFDPIASRAYFYQEFEEGKDYVQQQNIEIQGKTIENTIFKDDKNTKSTKDLLLEETAALQKSLLQIQQDINAIQSKSDKDKTPLTTVNNVKSKVAKTKATSTKSKQQSTSKAKVKVNTVADFTIIEGIGPKIAVLLKKAGIYSMENLSNTSVDRLKQILKEAGGKFNFATPETWSQQAELAAAGKMKELEILKDELIGGKFKSKK